MLGCPQSRDCVAAESRSTQSLQRFHRRPALSYCSLSTTFSSSRYSPLGDLLFRSTRLADLVSASAACLRSPSGVPRSGRLRRLQMPPFPDVLEAAAVPFRRTLLHSDQPTHPQLALIQRSRQARRRVFDKLDICPCVPPPNSGHEVRCDRKGTRRRSRRHLHRLGIKQQPRLEPERLRHASENAGSEM